MIDAAFAFLVHLIAGVVLAIVGGLAALAICETPPAWRGPLAQTIVLVLCEVAVFIAAWGLFR